MPKRLKKKRAPKQPAWAEKFGNVTISVEDTETTVRLTPEEAKTFEAHYRARMAALGAKGGKISGAKRMENLSAKRRKEIAKRAAAARWGKERP